ncbi:MAG: phosphate acyltransferase PlsX [Candidatus Krumholzibacteriia bacterium]|nr:phosphate acyltransferase PlsX [Candidatus Latescibacterota bacterium]
MKLALDVMGGDHGPPVLVRGALKARRELDAAPELRLYGDADAIRVVLAEEGEGPDSFEIVHTTESIAMSESPASAVRKKKDSPIVRGMLDLKAGEVGGIVSAGSTGAMVAGAMFHVGRLPGVLRPAIATWFPSKQGGCVVLDVGANSENKPEHLAQFGVMGRLFAEAVLRREKPRVGLLNIGEESSKGSELYVKAHELLAAAPVNFVGNVEGADILAGEADVVVCDGFTGNVVLKLAESMVGYTTRLLMGHMKESVLGTLRGKLGALLMKDGLRRGQQRIRKDLDYAEHGGAPLMGVGGAVIISHGKSNELAIMNAVRTAARFQELHTAQRMEALLGQSQRQSQGESLGA